MWKFLLPVIAFFAFTSCKVQCRNSIHGWEYYSLTESNYKNADEIRLELDRLADNSIAGEDPKDTVSDPDNITTLSLYHDTLFLRRNVRAHENYTSYNYIYIDTDRSSKYYNWLMSFEFDKYDIQSLESYDITDVKSTDDLKSNEMSGLPKNWLPLYSFNSEYYIYKPSDFGNAGKRILSEDYFIYWYMDGPMPYEILADKPNNNDKYVFVLKDYDDYPMEFIVYCIDAKNQLYVFEYSDRHGNHSYQLYTPAENAKSFDLIVNTGNEKAWEYDFDDIDYKSLLPPE